MRLFWLETPVAKLLVLHQVNVKDGLTLITFCVDHKAALTRWRILFRYVGRIIHGFTTILANPMNSDF